MTPEQMRGVIIAKCGYSALAENRISPTDAEIALVSEQANISFQAGRDYERAHPEGRQD